MSAEGCQTGEDPGRWARWCLRAEPRPLLLAALLLPLAYFWQYRTPRPAMVALAYYYDGCSGFFLFGLVAVGRVIQLHWRRSNEARFGLNPGVCQSSHRFWPWLLAIAAGTFPMLWFQVPMNVSFHLSRPALDRLADEALANPANVPLLAGRWAGLYRVDSVEVIGPTVVLYLGKDRGSYGFARVPGAKSDVIFNMPGLEDNPHYHGDFPQHDGPRDPQGMQITDAWFIMYSAYWQVKVGWS